MVHEERTLSLAMRWAESNLAAKGWERFAGSGTSTSIDWRSHHPCFTAEGLSPEAEHPIVAHLRSAGPHYRGCWAVDLVLGKE